MKSRVFAFAAVLSVGCSRRIAGGSTDGGQVFMQACARCHGADGVPEPGMVARLGVKDLSSDSARRRLDDDALRRQIAMGSPNKQMPSFERALTDAQIDALITHVRTLQDAAARRQPSTEINRKVSTK